MPQVPNQHAENFIPRMASYAMRGAKFRFEFDGDIAELKKKIMENIRHRLRGYDMAPLERRVDKLLAGHFVKTAHVSHYPEYLRQQIESEKNGQTS
jgi:uncharacterized protein YlbG (UPF0298 family)